MQNPLIGRGWAFPPQVNPKGGITLTTDENEIQQAIRIILTTIPGERVMRPTFGSRLHELVFASINTETLATARRYVEEALKMWEPRIELTSVSVDPNHSDGCLLISLEYEVKATHDLRALVFPYYLIQAE